MIFLYLSSLFRSKTKCKSTIGPRPVGRGDIWRGTGLNLRHHVDFVCFLLRSLIAFLAEVRVGGLTSARAQCSTRRARCFLPTSTMSNTVARSSNAAAGPSTPLRALPSNLSMKVAPTIPSASQAYEPLIRTVLRQRLLRMFLSSAVFCWCLVALASTLRQGGPAVLGVVGFLFNPIAPRTLALTGVIWLVGVVPVIVLRKAYLTGELYYFSHMEFSPSSHFMLLVS